MTHVVRKPAPSSQQLKQLGQYANRPGHSYYLEVVTCVIIMSFTQGYTFVKKTTAYTV